MGGIIGGDEAVEKAAAVGRRPGEQPVHGRGEPEDAHMMGKAASALLRNAVDDDLAGLALAFGRWRRTPGRADAGSPAKDCDFGGDGPAAGASSRDHLGIGGIAQAAPGDAASEIASRRLVLPAPLGPVNATWPASI